MSGIKAEDLPAITNSAGSSEVRRGRTYTSVVARFVFSLLAAGAVSLLIFQELLPRSLDFRTDIVGYSTFADFDSNRYFYAFYLGVIVFPIVAAIVYHVTGRFHSRHRRGRRPPMFPLEVRETAKSDERRAPSGEAIAVLTAVVRVAMPACVIATEVSITQSPHSTVITLTGASAGVAYVAAVAILGVVLERLAHRSRESGRRPLAFVPSVRRTISAVNALLGLAVLPLLYGVSGSTTITVGTAGHVVRYRWLPVWLIVVTTVAAASWTITSLRNKRPRDPSYVEYRTLLIFVGAIAVFLVTAVFPGSLGSFAGFDDSQYLAAPQLVFVHGLLPWGQLFLYHGLLYDLFSGAFGMFLFGHSRWGVSAGQLLLLNPATWAAYYLAGAYFLRRHGIVVFAFFLSIVLGLIGLVDFRWLIYAFLYILLDKVLRKKSALWSVAFTVAVLIQAIIVPESDLIDAVLLIAVIGFDWCTRRSGVSWRENFARTGWCVISGGVFGVAFVAYLVGTHSLGGFYEFYSATVSGHNLEGAHPIGHVGLLLTFGSGPSLRFTVELFLPVLLVLLTAWMIVAKLRRRSPWETEQWVMVAAALGVIVYFQEALARADYGHIAEMFLASLPLVILWLREASNFAYETVPKWRDALMSMSQRLSALRRMATLTWVVGPVLGISVLLISVFCAPIPLNALRGVPIRFHSYSPVTAPTEMPRLGYTDPGSVDIPAIQDLGKVIETYAGPKGPIFDFNNEPGVLYYLLNRVPGTQFDLVSDAFTAPAQNLLVAELEKSNPRLVLFTSATFGLPAIDVYNGIPIYDFVQNYIISQYILDHYRPLVNIDGQFLMLRDDLVGKVPSLPALSVPSTTTGLYDSVGGCAWGYTPNFLNRPDITGGQTVHLGVSEQGSIAETLVGWAVDTATAAPASSVLAVRDGHVVAGVQPSIARPDVVAALNRSGVLDSGFSISVPSGPGELVLYALNSDGTVSALPGQNVTPESSIILSNGTRANVVAGSDQGHIDTSDIAHEVVLTLTVPPGTNLSRFQWMTVKTSGGDGRQEFSLSSPESSLGASIGNLTNDISWWSLPQGGSTLSVQVGSCLQWHGFGQSSLSLGVVGAGTVRSVTLTRVRSD